MAGLRAGFLCEKQRGGVERGLTHTSCVGKMQAICEVVGSAKDFDA